MLDYEYDEWYEECCYENNGYYSYIICIVDFGCVLKCCSNNYVYYYEGLVYFRDVDLVFIFGRCVDNFVLWEIF